MDIASVMIFFLATVLFYIFHINKFVVELHLSIVYLVVFGLLFVCLFVFTLYPIGEHSHRPDFTENVSQHLIVFEELTDYLHLVSKSANQLSFQ